MTNKFVLMSSLFTNSIYKCEADDPTTSCNGGVYAYVYPSDMSQYIYMCEFTFNYPVRLLTASFLQTCKPIQRVEICSELTTPTCQQNNCSDL